MALIQINTSPYNYNQRLNRYVALSVTYTYYYFL